MLLVLIAETREFAPETQLDRSGRTISLLPDDYFGDPTGWVLVVVFVDAVHLRPIYEQNHISILLDGA